MESLVLNSSVDVNIYSTSSLRRQRTEGEAQSYPIKITIEAFSWILSYPSDIIRILFLNPSVAYSLASSGYLSTRIPHAILTVVLNRHLHHLHYHPRQSVEPDQPQVRIFSLHPTVHTTQGVHAFFVPHLFLRHHFLFRQNELPRPKVRRRVASSAQQG